MALNNYFKDKTFDSYLNDLIEQASQATHKFVTLDFTNSDQLTKMEKDKYIAELKNSSSLLNRLKGHSLSIWTRATTKIDSHLQNKKQDKKEAEFFDPRFKKIEEKVRVQNEAIYEPTAQESREAFIRSLIFTRGKLLKEQPLVWEHLTNVQQNTVRNYLEKAGKTWKSNYVSVEDVQKIREERNALAHHLKQSLPGESICDILGEGYSDTVKWQSAEHEKLVKGENNTVTSPKRPQQPLQAKTASVNDVAKSLAPDQIQTPQRTQQQPWQSRKAAIKDAINSLSPGQKQLFNNYQQMTQESSALYALVQAEKEGDEKSTHHIAWKVTCGKRNEAAYQFLKSIPKNQLAHILNPRAVEFLGEQAARHERLRNRQNSHTIDLDAKLKDSLDILLYRLFPEGPTKQTRKEWRFGSNGSLAVTLQGKEAGCYYSFEESKGGGPLQLIQKALGLDAKQARDWAMDFMGTAKEIVVPPAFIFKKSSHNELESQWIAIRPSTNDPAPELENIRNCKLSRYCKEEARYSYQDEKGALLFYTVRLIDKKGKKSVLPLSYGIEKDGNQEPHWAFKAYQTNERPLYNLQLLSAISVRSSSDC